MARWTIDTPTSLTFDGVVALRIRLVSGSVAVLAAEDRPRLDVESVSGQPLLVTHDAGILTITYEDMTWDGVLGWLRPQRHSARHRKRCRGGIRHVRADVGQERFWRHHDGRRNWQSGCEHSVGLP